MVKMQRGAVRGKVYAALIALSLVVGWLLHVATGGDYSTQEGGLSDASALLLCQKAIRARAVDPDTVEVPYVRNNGKGDEFYFAWGAQTKFIRMNNRLGRQAPVSASCVVDGSSRRITSMTLKEALH